MHHWQKDKKGEEIIPLLLIDMSIKGNLQSFLFGYATLTFVYNFCSISLLLHDIHNYFPWYYM